MERKPTCGSPQGGLRAIAVMDAPVDDQHAIEPQFIDGGSRGDGYVVEEAEAHGPARQGVMSRRPDQAQGLGVFAADDAFGRIGNAPGRQHGHLIGGRTDHRIDFHVPAARLRVGPDLIDVRRGMDASEPATVDRRKIEAAALGNQPRLLQSSPR